MQSGLRLFGDLTAANHKLVIIGTSQLSDATDQQQFQTDSSQVNNQLWRCPWLQPVPD